MWLFPYPQRQPRLSCRLTASISWDISSLRAKGERQTKESRVWLCGPANGRASGLREHLVSGSRWKNLLIYFCIGESLEKVPDSWGVHSKAQSPITPLPLRHRHKKNELCFVGKKNIFSSTHFQNFIFSKLYWCHVPDAAVFSFFLLRKQYLRRFYDPLGKASAAALPFTWSPAKDS